MGTAVCSDDGVGVMSYKVDTCMFKTCPKECKESEHEKCGWVTVHGRVWAFGKGQSQSKELSFCGWEHFMEYVKAGGMER